MSRFPLSIDLTGKVVFLIGNGPQIQQKAEKLAPFGAVLIRRATFTEADAQQLPALVIVGDTELAEAEHIFSLCCQYRIAVNVVDVPRLCSFYFPALITRGDLTVSISTDGSSPAAAACLRQRIEGVLPDRTGEILDWLSENRQLLREKKCLSAAAGAAFSAGRPLTAAEVDALCRDTDTV